jgi:hypothetical protein
MKGWRDIEGKYREQESKKAKKKSGTITAYEI